MPRKAAPAAPKPMYKCKVEYAGEKFAVEIICPRWALHKLDDSEPSAAFEDEGGEQMFDLYVLDHGGRAAKKVYDAIQAKKEAEVKAANDKRLASLKASFDVFDTDGSGSLDTEEVVEILTRMTGGGTAMSEADALEFIKEFDRDGDGFLDVNEFIIAMGVVSDAHDADGDGVADMKDGTGEYDGKEEEFAAMLAGGEDLKVAGMEAGNVVSSVEQARRLQQ